MGKGLCGLPSHSKLRHCGFQGWRTFQQFVNWYHTQPSQEVIEAAPESHTGGGGEDSPCTWDPTQHLVSMRKCWIHEWRKNFSKSHVVRLGEEGELQDAYLTQNSCAPLGFSPGAGKARGHWVGAREELCHTVVRKSVSLASSQGEWSCGGPGEVSLLEAGGRGSQRGDACLANGWVCPSDMRVLFLSMDVFKVQSKSMTSYSSPHLVSSLQMRNFTTSVNNDLHLEVYWAWH